MFSVLEQHFSSNSTVYICLRFHSRLLYYTTSSQRLVLVITNKPSSILFCASFFVTADRSMAQKESRNMRACCSFHKYLGGNFVSTILIVLSCMAKISYTALGSHPYLCANCHCHYHTIQIQQQFCKNINEQRHGPLTRKYTHQHAYITLHITI